MAVFHSYEIAKNLCAKQGHQIVSLSTSPVLGPPSTTGTQLLIPQEAIMCKACGLPIDKIRGRIKDGKDEL